MKKKAARPKNNVVKNYYGYRMHLQMPEAEAMHTMLDEYLINHLKHSELNSREKCVFFSLMETDARLARLIKQPRESINVQLSHAQFFAMHHVLKNEIDSTNTWEDVVLKTIFISLDKLIV